MVVKAETHGKSFQNEIFSVPYDKQENMADTKQYDDYLSISICIPKDEIKTLNES